MVKVWKQLWKTKCPGERAADFELLEMPLCLFLQINNMKTKFKETIEKCDSLEQRLNDLLKEKQSVERKWVPLPGLVPCSH